MPERMGLVKARLRGLEAAQAPIVIFLDSHIECSEGELNFFFTTYVDDEMMQVEERSLQMEAST